MMSTILTNQQGTELLKQNKKKNVYNPVSKLSKAVDIRQGLFGLVDNSLLMNKFSTQF